MSGAYELFHALCRVTADSEEEDGKFMFLFDPDNLDHELITNSLGGTQPEEGQTVRFSFSIKTGDFEVTTEGGRRRRRKASRRKTKRLSKK